jgi:hypothetical protein
MPQIEGWPRIPAAIRNHLIERMRDRHISLDDLNQLSELAGNQADCSDGTMV